MYVFPEVTKKQIERVKAWIARSPLARNRLVLLIWRVAQEMSHDDATHLAAGVAYYAVFSLFPLILGMLAIASTVVDSDGIRGRFLEFVSDNLPGSREFVEANVNSVIQYRGALSVISIIGLIWSASAVFGAISRAVNRAWDVHKDRPFYIAKPRHLAMALGVGILFVFSTSITSTIQVLTEEDLGIPGQDFFLELGVGSLILRAMPWFLTLNIFLLIYRFIPNCKTYWRYIWPGAIVAAFLFELSKNVFIWYLGNFANYNEVYGQVTSVIVLLFWTYLSSLILILGAEISSEYERLRVTPGSAMEDELEDDGF